MKLFQSNLIVFDELNSISKSLKEQNKLIGYIDGCFDIIHIGHIELFRFAKSKVDFLFVGLANDKYIEISKGKDRPVFNEKIRISQLMELKSIDYLFLLDGEYSINSKECDLIHANVLSLLKPDLLFVGKDEKINISKKNIAERFGAKLITYESQYSVSSTAISSKIFINL